MNETQEYLTHKIAGDDELYHYGVLGMKWGHRRYQNSNGTLTSEGKKRYRTQLKEDNKKAFENGRDATVAGKAVNYSMKRTIKDEKKLEKAFAKDPDGLKESTKRKRKNVETDYKTTEILGADYQRKLKTAKDHCDELIKRYGKENVKSINYKEYKNEKLGSFKLMDEKVISGQEWVSSAAITGTSMALLYGSFSPIGIVSIPSTGNERGRSVYRNTRRTVKQQNK